MKMLIHPPIDERRLARVREAAGAMEVVNAESLEEALQEVVGADAFFGKLTPPLLKQAQRLQWVQSPTASLEHYLFPELIAHPCRLTNMRGLFSDVIADHVLGYVLCFARNLHVYLRQQIEHRWAPVGGEAARPSFAQGPGNPSPIDLAHLHLSDCTLGIVGVGAIGSEIARRATAFGMQVLGVDPLRESVPGAIEAVWPTSRLHDLLAASDFVVIAAPHTPDTVGLIGPAELERMPRESYLINIGRGVIVQLDALTWALQSGAIRGAALDVFEIEPLPAEHPLWSLPNVILTPHVAAASPRVSERHTETLLENIRRFVNGRALLTEVNKEAWF